MNTWQEEITNEKHTCQHNDGTDIIDGKRYCGDCGARV